jgi:hypothetical protein
VDEVLLLPLSSFMEQNRYFVGPVPLEYGDRPVQFGAQLGAGRPTGAATMVQRFLVRPGEELWGTQGSILYELLAHLARTRTAW